MARGILFLGAAVWLLAGAACLGVAALGTPQLEAALPPLVIDTDALRGAIVALGGGMLAVGVAHVVVLIGLGARRRWGSTFAILLAALLTATLIALAAASATSAAATPEYAAAFLVGVAIAAVAAIGYALVVARLVRARRSGSAD
ncbi:MAG TPA: hypothetical protein VJ850_06440 [Candidatus Limnocylindrales bacterium]|nr:hypothetical protein [Candidatus Limnocylindrales bacterium]